MYDPATPPILEPLPARGSRRMSSARTQPSIESSFPHRAATLCGLYFAQGVPWGFVTIALVAYLNERGVDRTQTAVLLSMSLLPWTFKLFWGPIIASFHSTALPP